MVRALLKLLFVLSVLLPRQVFSQFILPPDLQCVRKDASNNNVTLEWTNIPNTCGPFVSYTIYYATSPNGPYNQLVQITNPTQTNYVHTGGAALGQTLYYYIVPDFNCPGFTPLHSDTVSTDPPSPPQIVNVTVQNGQSIINWIPSTSPQTHGYVIYYYLPSNQTAIAIDTVYGQFVNTYTDAVGDPTTEPLEYTIAAFDSCWTFSSFVTKYHNTIHVSAASVICRNEISVSWNSYIHWPQGVKEYQIWSSVNGGAFQQVGTADTSNLTYSYTGGFNDGDTVCVFVRAVSAADTNVTSVSNIACLVATVVKTPAYNFILNATVNNNQQIEFTWMIDSTAALIYQRLERSVNNITYSTIEQYAAVPPVYQFNTYTDQSGAVLPQKNPYYYQVTLFDSCQNLYTSPYVKTICLKGELYDYYLAVMQWNDFELQHSTLLQQRLYRNTGGGYQLVQIMPPGVNEYADTLKQFLHDPDGVFCYRLEQEYDLQLPNGYRDTLSSWSNELCIVHRPIIYIPNAFAPYGKNNIFKPTIIYGNPKGYEMRIYNRWGGLVFISNDPNTGWDGTDHGKPADMGGYAYLIQFTAEDGVKVERKGMVLLVK
ncbi:MAG: gliding motility-associated C-terminal domain-containing protein [Chitinophagales bacterium]|nr:gliding motility-associated C-terminal domain-containing protein [Chitinophagales bacterium]MDW8418480.1 gliding motility-associated C-terminal domain-containing protein [Chitinophagales bacterium]